MMSRKAFSFLLAGISFLMFFILFVPSSTEAACSSQCLCIAPGISCPSSHPLSENNTCLSVGGPPAHCCCPEVEITNFSADRTTIFYGESTTLRWSSSNARFCWACCEGDWRGSKGTSGSESTGSLTSRKVYDLACYPYGSYGSPDSVRDRETVVVDVRGECSFGTTQTRDCGSAGTPCFGTQTRLCQFDRTWSGWSSCPTDGNWCDSTFEDCDSSSNCNVATFQRQCWGGSCSGRYKINDNCVACSACDGDWCGSSWEACDDPFTCDVDTYQSQCSGERCSGTFRESGSCVACDACDGSVCGNCGTCSGRNCAGQGVCSPLDPPQDCGKCGTQACQADCSWELCQNEGVCFPGPDNSDCPCPSDECIGFDYYDYPENNGDCLSACDCDTGTGSGRPCELTVSYYDARCPFGFENPLETGRFETIINTLINFIFKIALVLAPLMIIIAGFLFVTAGADLERAAKAKRIIIWTIIALIVILIAKGIWSLVQQILGGF